MRVSIVLALGALLAAAPTYAQEAPTSSFAITEIGYGYNQSANAHYAALEWGRMWPVADRVAVGVAGHVGITDGELYGVKPRIRAYLSDGVSLDIASGVLLGWDRPTISSHLGLGLGESLILTAQLDRRSTKHYDESEPYYQSSTELYLGARLGGRAGVIGTLVGSLAGVVVLAVIFSALD
jgi:hypothetical protein